MFTFSTPASAKTTGVVSDGVAAPAGVEQHVNASDLPEAEKVKLQSYVSGCYGTLTSFNVLFADEDDQFKGSGGE